MWNFEELEEKLSSQLSIIALETGDLVTEKGQLWNEVDKLERHVLALESRLRQAEGSKRIKQGHMQAQELEQRGERMNTMFRGHKEAELRSLVENGASERQALMREAIKKTNCEGVTLENELRSLKNKRRDFSDDMKPKDLLVSQDMVNVLGRRKDLEKDHLSETCLAAEHAASLDASMRRLEMMMERRVKVEASMKVPSSQEAWRKESNDAGRKPSPFSPTHTAVCPEVVKRLTDLSGEVEIKEKEVIVSMSNLRDVVKEDQKKLLARKEFPSRIHELKCEIERVVEEKRQFLLQLEEERAHLMEERMTLNILLAAKNMAKERNTAGVDQGDVILVEDDVDASRSNEMELKFNQEEEKEESQNTPLARCEETKSGENLQNEAFVKSSEVLENSKEAKSSQDVDYSGKVQDGKNVVE